MGRKTGASQADNTAVADKFLEFCGLGTVIFLGGLDIEPGVIAIRFQHDTGRFADYRVRHGVLANIRDRPRGAGMNRNADITIGAGDDLALQYLVACVYRGCRRLSDMLLQRQEHALRQGLQDGRFAVRNLLVRLQQQSALKIMQFTL